MTVEFTPEEYLYVDKKNFYKFRIGNSSTYNRAGICGDYGFILGGFALTKFEVVMGSIGSKQSSIAVYGSPTPDPPVPPGPSGWKTFFVVLLILLLIALVVGALYYFLVVKKRQDSGVNRDELIA